MATNIMAIKILMISSVRLTPSFFSSASSSSCIPIISGKLLVAVLLNPGLTSVSEPLLVATRGGELTSIVLVKQRIDDVTVLRWRRLFQNREYAVWLRKTSMRATTIETPGICLSRQSLSPRHLESKWQTHNTIRQINQPKMLLTRPNDESSNYGVYD